MSGSATPVNLLFPYASASPSRYATSVTSPTTKRVIAAVVAAAPWLALQARQHTGEPWHPYARHPPRVDRPHTGEAAGHRFLFGTEHVDAEFAAEQGIVRPRAVRDAHQHQRRRHRHRRERVDRDPARAVGLEGHHHDTGDEPAQCRSQISGCQPVGRCVTHHDSECSTKSVRRVPLPYTLLLGFAATCAFRPDIVRE